MKNNYMVVVLRAPFLLSLLIPQVSFAHSSHSAFAQLMHSMTHAHHAFGGLLLIAVMVSALKIRKKLVTKRIQQKR